LPLLFNFALEHVIRKVPENRVKLKLNGTHQLLVSADDVNLLGDTTGTIKKNTETLNGARKEAGIENNADRTKYVVISCHHNAGQNHDIKIANRSFENVAHFEYFATTVTDQNSIREEIKRRLNSSNAWYHSLQKFLSSRLLSNNINTGICKSIILPGVLYGCETWSLTLREEHRLRVLKNKVLRIIFGPKRDKVTRG
jgi:hypothetical protein